MKKEYDLQKVCLRACVKILITGVIVFSGMLQVQAQDMKGMEMIKKKTATSSNKVEKIVAKNSESKYINNRPSKMVRYDLYVSDTTVNFTGKNANAMAINGQIPAPVLEFTEGDTAEIYVHNQLASPTSIHWHGVLVPNQYDGVTYLTTAPIMPNTTHLFTFPIIQNGTTWYHSHDLMEQIGLDCTAQ